MLLEERKKEILEGLAKGNSDIFNSLTGEEKNDPEIAKEVVILDPESLYDLSEENKNNPEIVMAGVVNYGSVLVYASEELRNNRQIVMAAVKNDPLAITHASKELQEDPEILEIKKTAEEIKNKEKKELGYNKNTYFTARDKKEEEIKNDFSSKLRKEVEGEKQMAVNYAAQEGNKDNIKKDTGARGE